MHFATIQDLLFADNGNIVLNLATHHTRTTTGACIEVNGHGPMMTFVIAFLPQGNGITGYPRVNLLGGSILLTYRNIGSHIPGGRIGRVFRQGGFLHVETPFDGMMGLGLGNLVRFSGFL